MQKDPENNLTFTQKSILNKESLITHGKWVYDNKGNKIAGSYYGNPIGFCRSCNKIIWTRLPLFGILDLICHHCVDIEINSVLSEVTEVE